MREKGFHHEVHEKREEKTSFDKLLQSSKKAQFVLEFLFD